MALHRISKGLDLPLAGAPEQRVSEAPTVRRVALAGDDHHGLKSSLRVREGDRVLRGQPLHVDTRLPSVPFTAPGAGTVSAIHRGERRRLLSVVVTLDERDVASAGQPDARLQAPFAAFTGRPVAELSRADVVALLVESGMWNALRARPFSRVPDPHSEPFAIFVTAIDTHPNAADPAVVLADRGDDFARGVAAVAALTSGRTYVCVAPGFDPPVPSDARIAVETFAGPHPAGTPGVHIHRLAPVDLARTVWHVGYQDVAAIGHLFATGELDLRRVVALGGPGVRRPRLLAARAGASLDDLTRDELAPGELRVVTGSVLGGRTAMGEPHAWLGRYDQQVSVLAEGRRRELFGYVAPGADKYSVWNVVLGRLRKAALPLTTTTNGGPRAMVPIGSYERVMPMDLMATFLLRALITGDLERAEELGCLELDEEDLALCTFVCPGKTEYGPLLRDLLARIEKEA